MAGGEAETGKLGGQLTLFRFKACTKCGETWPSKKGTGSASSAESITTWACTGIGIGSLFRSGGSSPGPGVPGEGLRRRQPLWARRGKAGGVQGEDEFAVNEATVVLKGTGSLLAISPGTRRTGWAVFIDGQLKDTGTISIPAVLRARAGERAVLLVCSLDELAVRWDVGTVACRGRSSAGLPAPGAEPLEAELSRWREFRGLAWYPCTTAEVRTALAGKPMLPGKPSPTQSWKNSG